MLPEESMNVSISFGSGYVSAAGRADGNVKARLEGTMVQGVVR